MGHRDREGATALSSVGSVWRARDVEFSGAEAGPRGLGNLFLTLNVSAMICEGTLIGEPSNYPALLSLLCLATQHRGSCKMVHSRGHVHACCLSNSRK